jgi:1-acyl-sn-glycerol-3-phosphate acyltransferase
MKVLREVTWLLGVVLSGYAVAWTFGLFVLGPVFLFFLLTGRVRVRGYWNLIGAILKGRVMILTNHPTVVVETFGMGAILFPWFLFFPQFFLWQMPDKRLLDGWHIPNWMRTALRCILVDRSTKLEGGGPAFEAIRILRAGGVIVAFPEGGRTFGSANRHKMPLERRGRQMQEIKSSLTRVAHVANAWILPGWIEVPHSQDPITVSGFFSRVFGTGKKKFWPVIFHFGPSAYKPRVPFDRTKENKKLQKSIFRS